ncbi:MAG: hypothetical protein EBX49_10835 [Synechococcaceae bacterium WB8_1B_136]|nr:hypothetical protein [Synechococcaceae bacterium WB8_1B_136]
MDRVSLAGLVALLALAGPGTARAGQPLTRAGSCADSVVQSRLFTPAAAAPGAKAVEEVVLTLANGMRLEGPELQADTTFFWNFTPGHKVQVCLDAQQPQRQRQLRVTDLVTGASLTTRESKSL